METKWFTFFHMLYLKVEISTESTVEKGNFFWSFTKGTIPIIRQQIIGLFGPHPPTLLA